jgi:hypothetical protein
MVSHYRVAAVNIIKDPRRCILRLREPHLVVGELLMIDTFRHSTVGMKRIGFDRVSLDRLIGHLRKESKFYGEFLIKIEEANRKKVEGWIPLPLLEILYASVRLAQPRIVVETGVGPGSSSLFILKALHDNGCGKLYSIDLPDFDRNYYPSIGKRGGIHVFEDGVSGWLVPDDLRDNWELLLADARSELPKLLSRLGEIDFFLHDSLHTYDHMMFEYNLAWEHLRNNGILASDDVTEDWSTAFLDFCVKKGVPSVRIDRFGMTCKRS